jgi:hypothetical protein
MNRLEETMPKIKSSSMPEKVTNILTQPLSTFTTAPTEVSANQENMLFSGMFDWKTWMIIILLLVLFFTYLGINLLGILGNSMQQFVDIFSPVITDFLAVTGYSTGAVLNKTADIVGDTAKETIDIAEDAVQNVGNLLMKSGDPSQKKSTELHQAVQEHKQRPNDPEPDESENSIQKPISSSKYNWCLVGEYQNKRGCVPITESDKCLSGHVFPTQKMCLNPNLTNYQK